MSATITFKEVPSQSIICQLSFLTSLYMLAFPLIYLISDGGSCGLTAGKSVPPPLLPLSFPPPATHSLYLALPYQVGLLTANKRSSPRLRTAGFL